MASTYRITNTVTHVISVIPVVVGLLFDAVGGAIVAALNTPQLRDVADSIAGQFGVGSR